MKKNISLSWRIYFIVFSTISIGNLLVILNVHSPIYTYYHTLLAFNENYIFTYFFNIISCGLNVLSLLALFAYIYKRRIFNILFWKIFLVLRIIFEASGHLYETRFLQSLWYTDTLMAVITIFLSLVVVLPSYLACFRYAFKQNRFLSQ